MERLTMQSDKGGLAFTFDLDITCNKTELEKIIKLGKRLKEYEDLEEEGLLLKLPCNIGDIVYIITTCKTFPPKLDGTMWDADGGFGTATGYYCPYEESDSCPFADCEDCSSVENELGIFEDVACHMCIEEDKIWFVFENSNGWELSDFGKTIFIKREDAEMALNKLKK